MLEQAHHEGRYADLVAKLDVYLTRDNDRQLFDLPARGQDDPRQDQTRAMSDNTHPTLATVATNTTKG